MTALEGRTILVTGATGVLGTSAVAAAALEGARVVAIGRDADILAEVQARHPDCVRDVAVTDLLDMAAVTRLASGPGSGVDAVWHLVGGWRGGTPLPEQPLADWEALHDALARTTVHLARAFADRLAARPSGRFAIVSSPFATAPTSRNAAYATAKAAAEAAVLALADHLRPTAATANIVVVPAIGPHAVPAGEVASALVYLTSDAAAKMNGQRVRLHSRGQ